VGGGSARAEAVRDAFALDDSKDALVVLDDIHVRDSGITYVTGYSGTGKSTLLGLIARRHPEAMELPVVIDEDMLPIDMFPEDIADTVRCLSHVGLGEARIFVTPYKRLSDGQKLRLRLALLLHRRPKVVIIDEFLSSLDRLTAKIVAFNFQKLCRRFNITAYLASSHEDLIEPLAPDWVVFLDFNGKASTMAREEGKTARIPEADEIEVDYGTAEDCRVLDRFHYRRVEYDSVEWDRAQVRVARFRGNVVGIGIFRPPLPSTFEKMPFLAKLNRSILQCFRTVVHPVFRGIGLYRRLEPVVDSSVRAIMVVSAFEVFFPYHLKLGYLPSKDPLETKLESQVQLEDWLFTHGVRTSRSLRDLAAAQAFYEAQSPENKKVLAGLIGRVAVEMNVAFCEFLARLARCEVSDQATLRAELLDFFGTIVARADDRQVGRALALSLHFPMRGFYKPIGASGVASMS